MIELRRYPMIATGFAGVAILRLFRAAGLLIAVLATTAAGEHRRTEVAFAPGATGTVLRDRLAVDASARQVLDLVLNATNDAVMAEDGRTASGVEANALAAPPRPPTVIEHQVIFPAGSVVATYAGETRPRVATDYRLDLPPDARLTVKLLAEDPRASFEIIAPGGASVHRAGSGGVWKGHLARDGTWTIRVVPSTGAEARYYIGFMVE